MSDCTAQHAPEWVEVGKIVGVFGVKGWLRVLSYCDPHEQISAYSMWRLSSEANAFTVETVRSHNKRLFAKLQGIDDRTQAHTCCGSTIRVSPDDLPALAEGEYYWHQLLGLEVVNMCGERLGVVKRLIATGVHDVVIVSDYYRNAEYLIPYVKQLYIKAVDFEDRLMTVDWDREWLV